MRRRIASLWASSPSQLTPHPARFPMKCIGIAGHVLLKGEGARRRRAGEGFFHSMKPETWLNLRIRVQPARLKADLP